MQTIEADYALLDLPVTVLRMNLLTRVALQRIGIKHLGDLVQYSKRALEEQRGLGPRSVDLLRDQLIAKGVDYGMKVSYVPPEERK